MSINASGKGKGDEDDEFFKQGSANGQEADQQSFVDHNEGEESEEVGPPRRKKCFCYRLWDKYDHSFLVVYVTQYANGGLKFLNLLACQDLFKNYYELQPAKSSSLLAIIWIPWGIKFMYGITADSISICGSRKKSWLIVMGFCQLIALSLCAFVDFNDISWFIFAQFIVSISGAFMDVIADALMVIQAKRDPLQGSQDLQSLAWLVTAIGAVSGGFFGAFMTGFLDPTWCFGFYAMFSFAVLASACRLNPALEVESDFDAAMSMTLNGVHIGRRRNFCEEVRHNYHIVKHEFKMRLFQRTILFYVLVGLTHCRYDEFMYYYKLNVLGLTQFQYACLQLGGAFFMTFAVIAYNKFMREWETRTVVSICTTVMILNGFASLMITLRWNVAIGINDIVFLAFTGTTFFPIIMALFIIPPFVLIAKITPCHVEATIFSFAASVINTGIHFGGKYMGLAWNKAFFDVTTENLETELWKLMLLEAAAPLLIFFYMPLIPTWEEVREQQAHLAELNKDSDDEEDEVTSDKSPTKLYRLKSMRSSLSTGTIPMMTPSPKESHQKALLANN